MQRLCGEDREHQGDEQLLERQSCSWEETTFPKEYSWDLLRNGKGKTSPWTRQKTLKSKTLQFSVLIFSSVSILWTSRLAGAVRALRRHIHNDFILFLLYGALSRTYLVADSVVSSEVQSLPIVPRRTRRISMLNQCCPVRCQLLPLAMCVPTLAVLRALRMDMDLVGSHRSIMDMEPRVWNTSMSCLRQGVCRCRCANAGCVCVFIAAHP